MPVCDQAYSNPNPHPNPSHQRPASSPPPRNHMRMLYVRCVSRVVYPMHLLGNSEPTNQPTNQPSALSLLLGHIYLWYRYHMTGRPTRTRTAQPHNHQPTNLPTYQPVGVS